ncbi:MAG: FAD-binding protein, partial [Candidatus Schekmanbacteria bacterium]
MSENGKNRKVGSVLVLGGGVAGMQSAIDLADSGYRVYLAEKTPFIGGKMAQLDKTFPTNDCAMCTISPRLVGVGRHLNIDILAGVELIRVEGEAGNFKVFLKQNERLIDPAKCTACGDCKKVCPVEVESEFDLGLSKRNAIYKSYSQAVPNAYAIDKRGLSACKISCPAGISVQGYIALIAKGKYKEAYNLIMKNNPLPGVCGRMCHHPCESECRRGLVDEAISIRNLRRFLADKIYGDPDFTPPQAVEKKHPEKIAIIGAGPSGLSCAYYLALEGYNVEIFEALPVKGGMLAVGIPEYRVPAKSLAIEISNIEALGVKIHTNTRIGKDIAFSKLKEDFDVVYIATGAHLANKLNIPGSDNENVIDGVEFLRKVSLGEEVKKGKKAVVIGGGNVALDVARTALRLGYDVSLMCLENEEEIPCHPWELEEAIEEGVKVNYSLGPKEIVVKDGKIEGVRTIKVKSVFDSEGKFNPQFYEGTEGLLKGDTVFLAIGQRPDLSFLDCDLETQQGNRIKVDPSLLRTSDGKIYAGGDVVRGPASAIEAIADGRRAAMVIDSKLRNKPIPEDVRPEPTEPEIEGKRIKKEWKKVPPKLSPEERIKDFSEIEKPFSEEDALAEALRCLHCSVCSDCRLCEEACEAKAISHEQPIQTVKQLDVGAIILAPGFEYYDVDLKEEFGHRRFSNVLSSLEFERILSAGGPFMGEIKRLSDGKPPKKIAWIQCVGSRDEERDYCSSVCCMYATKQARLVKEHLPDAECTIFFIDLRAFGKGFDDYCKRAEALGVRYVRCRPSNVKEDPLTQNLLFQYITPEGKPITEEFDMVVLSGGLGIGKEQKEVAETLGIELNEFNFCKTGKWDPLYTNREGIYTCGAFTEPKDIPESVTQASGAAALAIEQLSDVRNTCTRKKEYPEERDVSKEEPRVGVFVCRCGTNIGGVIEVPSVVEYVKQLPNVVFAEENMYTCAADSLEKIKEMIKEHNLNRVVVTSCTPRTHEPLFQEALREAGLNPYLFEMANIRDQCTWVHANTPDKALNKAKTLAQMAVMRARKLNPLYNQDIDICRDVLVIGGGIAGMTSA